jgi:hypothetical protein
LAANGSVHRAAVAADDDRGEVAGASTLDRPDRKLAGRPRGETPRENFIHP